MKYRTIIGAALVVLVPALALGQATHSVGTANTTLGILKLFGSTSGDVSIKPAAVAGTSTIFQLPANNGSSGQFLQTDGNGIATWETATSSASSITPGTTTVVGSTAPCVIENTTSTTMGCTAHATATAAGATATIAAGAQALGTGAITSATCATAVDVSATNVASTDVVLASFNGDPTGVTGYIPAVAGMLTIVSYPTSGNVHFIVCNNTSSSVTPGAITLNWRVVR